MWRALSFLFFVIHARLSMEATVSLGARIKFPRFVRLGRRCRIQADCSLDAPGPHELRLGERVGVNRGSYIGAFAPVSIGDRTDINRNVSIDARAEIRIGKDVLIGPGAQLIAYEHIFSAPDRAIITQGLRAGPITIEDDVWIGANALILVDVTLGRGSVVGAGAVVTHSCAPYSILAGVPARVIGMRDGTPYAKIPDAAASR